MKKPLMIVATFVMVLIATLPALAQEYPSDAPVLHPDPNDPYRIFISDDQAVYCGTGTLGDPITEFCIQSGVVPPVLYDQNGNLISGYGAGPGQYENDLELAQLGDCWYDPDDAYVIGPDSNIPILDTPCGTVY